MRSVITVDGLAGSGKTTLARLLSQRLGFIHLNSGLLYRGLGQLGIEQGINKAGGGAPYVRLLEQNDFSLVIDEQGVSRLRVGDRTFGDELFAPEVSDAASSIAPYEDVRASLLEVQRHAFEGRPIIAEGRDMGTVIFPTAPLKFFITADASIRAARRLSQLDGQRGGVSPQEYEKLKGDLAREITERDRRDQERLISPTVPAADAVILDNSSVTLTDMVDKMYASAADRGLLPG